MVTSNNLPVRIQALAQGAIMPWMLAKKQHKSTIHFNDIYGILLPRIRSTPEVRRWQDKSLLNDLSLIQYVMSFTIRLCHEYNLLHDIPLIIQKPA